MNFTLRPFGDHALLAEFDQVISLEVNQHVIALKRSLEQLADPTIEFLIPAYNSLAVGFTLGTDIEKLANTILTAREHRVIDTLDSIIEIPVCYSPRFAPDMKAICDTNGLTPEEVIDLHTSTVYHVYMLGFVAGFAYMGTLPDRLLCDRLAQPRQRVERGSVGLAGNQTGIYPTMAPGGWRIIGRTPVEMITDDPEAPFRLQAGDRVQFTAIGEEQFYSYNRNAHE